MSEHLRTVLAGMVANPDQRISAISLLTPEARRQIVVEWNDTSVPAPGDACVHHRFARQATRTPDAAALSFMPSINAAFNAMSAVLLVLAVRAIKQKRVARHQALMLTAFASSAFFLVGYLAYHYVHGDSKYPGHGGMRAAYLVLLASHVILSIPVVPMCLAAFYFAFKRRFLTHKKITKVLFPIWLYVSVTGVLVFFMLRSA